MRLSTTASILALASLGLLAGCGSSTTVRDDTARDTSRDTTDGFGGTSPQDLAPKLQVGTYWTYAWTTDNVSTDSHGSSSSQKQGLLEIEIVSATETPVEGHGLVTLYRGELRTSGDRFPILEFVFPRDMFVSGPVLYLAGYRPDGSRFGIPWIDFSTNEVRRPGFFGYLTDDNRRASVGTVTTPAVTAPGLTVASEFHDDLCETVQTPSGPEQVCDTEAHHYDIRESYVPGIGLVSMRREGRSHYTGGGYETFHEGTMVFELVDSNLLPNGDAMAGDPEADPGAAGDANPDGGTTHGGPGTDTGGPGPVTGGPGTRSGSGAGSLGRDGVSPGTTSGIGAG